MDWKEFRATYAPGRPLVVAHRGVPVRQPENTLASFRHALDEGADALETDLRFTRDNVIVLHHDATLERTTDGSGPLRDCTLEELQRLRTRCPDGTLSDERIPTLVDLVAMTGARIPLLLELKDPLLAEPEYARALADTLAALGMSEQVALVSFHYERVQCMKSVAPQMAAGFITVKQPLPRKDAQVLGPFWPLLYANPFYVSMAHRQGSIVCPLDVFPEPRLRYYLRRNVDALLANDPGSVRKALERVIGDS